MGLFRRQRRDYSDIPLEELEEKKRALLGRLSRHGPPIEHRERHRTGGSVYQEFLEELDEGTESPQELVKRYTRRLTRVGHTKKEAEKKLLRLLLRETREGGY